MKKIKRLFSLVIAVCVVMTSVVIFSQPEVSAGNWASCTYNSGTLSVDISTSSTTVSVTYTGKGNNYLSVQGYVYKLAATCNGSTSVGAEVDKSVAVAGNIKSYQATSSWNASSWAPGTYTCTMTCYVVANNGATDSTSTSKTVTVTCSHSGGYTRKDTSSTYLRSSATCTAKATYWYKCKNCTEKSSSSYYESGSTTAHNYTSTSTDVSHRKSAATCTSPAVYYKSCTVCGANDTSNTFTSGSALGHDFSSKTTTSTYLKSAANCTSKAVYYYKCSRCTASSSSLSSPTTYTSGSVDSTNHNYTTDSTDSSHRVSVATCTTPATYYYSCTRCGANDTSRTFTSGSVNSSNHTDVDADWTTTVPVTCTSDGTRVKYCQACHGIAVSETITHPGHTEVTDAAVTATCTTTGLTAGSHCSVCNTVLTAQETVAIDPTNHDYSSETKTSDYLRTAATCTADATYYYKCSRCSASSEGDTNTFYTDTGSAAHTPGTKVGTTATCTEAGTASYVCSVCGLEFTQAEAALGHDWDEWEVTSPATCIAAGSKSRTCLRDSNHTETDTIAIDPDAHNIDGVDWTITTPATTSTTGTRVKYCNLCHTVAVTETIPMIVNPTAVDVSPNSSAVEVGATRQLITTFTPADATATSSTWTSSDPTIATVSSTGLVTGVATGAVTITYTLDSDPTVTDEVSVSVVPATGSSTTDVINSHSNLVVNVGADATTITVAGTSCSASANGSNTFNFNIGLTLSDVYTRTPVEEGAIVAVVTLDNNFTASGGYIGKSGSTVYPSRDYSVFVPLVEGSNTFSIVSPTYIQPDNNDEVVWHVSVYLGGTADAPMNTLLYNSIVTFENQETSDATIAATVSGDPLVSQSATTKNIVLAYSNVSSMSVSVEAQNPATGIYTSIPSLTSAVTLTSSGAAYPITIGTGNYDPGTTLKLTFTGYDSSHNVVATDKCYLVVSWLN